MEEKKTAIWFPKRICLETTEQQAEAFVKDGLDHFLEYLFQAYPYTVSNYIDDHLELFHEFIISGGADV